jgi:hypothetical protein
MRSFECPRSAEDRQALPGWAGGAEALLCVAAAEAKFCAAAPRAQVCSAARAAALQYCTRVRLAGCLRRRRRARRAVARRPHRLRACARVAPARTPRAALTAPQRKAPGSLCSRAALRARGDRTARVSAAIRALGRSDGTLRVATKSTTAARQPSYVRCAHHAAPSMPCRAARETTRARGRDSRTVRFVGACACAFRGACEHTPPQRAYAARSCALAASLQAARGARAPGTPGTAAASVHTALMRLRVRRPCAAPAATAAPLRATQ